LPAVSLEGPSSYCRIGTERPRRSLSAVIVEGLSAVIVEGLSAIIVEGLSAVLQAGYGAIRKAASFRSLHPVPYALHLNIDAE
jgi:hypothetical protein